MIDYMRRQYDLNPARTVAHFGPSIGPKSYVMTYLSEALRQEAWRPFLQETDNGYETDIVGYAIQRLIENGLDPDNISRSPVDVAVGEDYFSHTAFKNRDQERGRNGFMAVID